MQIFLIPTPSPYLCCFGHRIRIGGALSGHIRPNSAGISRRSDISHRAIFTEGDQPQKDAQQAPGIGCRHPQAPGDQGSHHLLTSAHGYYLQAPQVLAARALGGGHQPSLWHWSVFLELGRCSLFIGSFLYWGTPYVALPSQPSYPS